jgi:pimeloyl-ACP methyl ester carboxylesterase
MMMINLAQTVDAAGEPVMSDVDRAVFAAAFAQNGFSGSIKWYRNMDRNWQILSDVDPIIRKPALMIYGDQDMIPKSENLSEFVPGVDVVSLNCGHWIQQELPNETTKAILDWLAGQ